MSYESRAALISKEAGGGGLAVEFSNKFSLWLQAGEVLAGPCANEKHVTYHSRD